MPIERLTTESPTPTPHPSKDPKKRAAGRAGAAARKAKHEKILDELRVTKAAMAGWRGDVAVLATRQGKSKEVLPAEPPSEDAVKFHHKTPNATVVAQSPPHNAYIVAGLVALGIGLLIRAKLKGSHAPTAVSRPEPPSSAPTQVAPDLNPGADIFDMQ